MNILRGVVPLLYLAFATTVALSSALHVPVFPFSPQPWQGWAMFADMADETSTLIARGTYANGTTIPVDVDQFFPKGPWITERSRAQEARDLFYYEPPLKGALCDYILARVNAQNPSAPLVFLELKLSVTPLKNPNTARTTAVISCGPPHN